MNAAKPVDHVFVDFENVKKIDLGVFRNPNLRFTLLVGKQQTKLDTDLVALLLEHAAEVELVRLSSSGKNALDFTLAHYLGRASVLTPASRFHVISKDKGFDPMIEHLASRGLSVVRHESFRPLYEEAARPSSARSAAASKSPAAAAQAPAAEVPEPEDARVLESLLRQKAADRPKKRRGLVGFVKSRLGKTAPAADCEAMVERWIEGGHLPVDAKGGVQYPR